MEIESDDEGDVQLQKHDPPYKVVPLEVAQEMGPSAESLDLTKNEVRNGENMEHFVNLDTLILDHNGISTLESFPVMSTLATLWLNNNEVTDLTSVVNQIRDRYPNLTYLSLLRNPVCPKLYFDIDTEDQYRRYRTAVLSKLPKLQFLDALGITDKERMEAARVGSYLVVAKAKATEYTKEVVPPDGQSEEETVDNPYGQDVKLDDNSAKAYMGRGKIKYDGKDSQGNRFIRDEHL